MEALLQDVRFSFRTLRKSPGFTLIAVLALALGIGANASIFSAVNAVLLRPLDYRDSSRLVAVWLNSPALSLGIDLLPSTALHYREWREQNHVFEGIALVTSASANLTGEGQAERLLGGKVSASLFPLLGAKPLLGRTFVAAEDRSGQRPVVIASHGLWQRRLGSDPGAVGRTIRLDGKDCTVIGVMPRGFGFPKGGEFPAYFEIGKQADFWLPLSLSEREANNAGSLMYAVLGRLKPGAGVMQAQAEMETISRRIDRLDPDFKTFHTRVLPFRESMVGQVKPALLVLLAAVGLVLLIACANVANLLLVRASGRQREIGLRAALGASRGRLVRQLLTESLILAWMGGLAGLGFAFWGVRALAAIMPADLPRLDTLHLDWTVVGFAMLAASATGVLFGLVPAWQASRADLQGALKEGARASAGALRRRWRDAFVVAEIAMAVVLLAGAGLLIRSFQRLQRVDPGFHPERVVAMALTLPDSPRYQAEGSRAAFFSELVRRSEAVPGVSQAAVGSYIPFSGGEHIEKVSAEGSSQREDRSKIDSADLRVVAPEFFATLQLKLLQGRGFSRQDGAQATRVAVIDETMARRFWPGQQAVGKRFHTGDSGPWLTVVGVARRVTYSGLNGPQRPLFYRPVAQSDENQMYLLARTAADPAGIVRALKAELWRLDPDQPVSKVVTLESLLAESVALPRFRSVMLGLFAALALVLASVGIYGVMAYSVAQRTREIGLRVALGAGARDVLGMVLGQGLRLGVAGVGIGLLAAVPLCRMLSSFLFGIGTGDPGTFAGVCAVSLGVAAMASWVPAMRAMRVQPMQALREE